MDFTVENVCGFLIRSKLLSPPEVKAMHDRWLAESREPGNLAPFSKWLVANKYVTEYQAALLLKGHADDFFLNQYQILDRLGRGRMAGVYRAVHHLGQVVAIKVLPPSKARNPQLLGRFQREARLAMRLKHNNVVRSFQVGEARGLQYLVMEYLEGETLDEVLQRRRKLPPAEGVRIVYQALLGLQHIHEQGMVHRDLKPSNLMLVPASGDTTLKSIVKILDIGLGRAFFEDSEAPEGNMELTGEGVLLGTPDYLAPEQARDPRSIDIRADIYSLGCVLYHVLTGQPPFPDTNLLSQMVRHATEAPRPLKDFNPAIPDGVQQILNWMLAKKPEERYPTPERAAQALQMFLVADSEPSRQSEEPQLRKFLTWLEAGTDGDGPEALTLAPTVPPAPPVAAAMPVALPTTPVAMPARPAVAVPAAAPPQSRRSRKTPTPPTREPPAKKHKHRSRAPQAAPVAQAAPASPATAAPVAQPATAAPMPEIDVELVPLGAVDAAGARRGWRLNRREWALLGIGAGSVIVAGAVGMILATVFRGGE